MAVITIPSSFSPIAAALDVFTQDRLAQQKRARQQEQDAWNREARGRQRQGWGRQDEIQRRQDLLWQEQRAAYAQANAEKQRLAQQHQDALGRYNENTLGTALGQETPAFTDTEMGGDWNEMAGETATTPGLREVLEANMSARAKYGNLWGMPSRAELISRMQGKTAQLTDQQIAEAISALEDPQISRTMKVTIAKQLEAQNITPSIINQVLGPKAAKTVHEAMSISDPNYMAVADALHNPDAMYTTESGFGVGDESVEEAGGEQGDYSRTQQRYTPQDRLALHQQFYGKPATPSQSAAYFKGPKAAAETVPFSHWQKAFGHSGGQVQTGDVMNSIEVVMKEALMDNLKSSDHYRQHGTIARDDEGNPTQIQPPKMSELFSAVQEEELMSNMWQAAQMIQRQYFPMKTPQIVFQEMKRAIGTGPKELDLINTTGTMAGYEPTGNHLSRYLHTPKIYNTQQIMQDYLDVLGIAALKESNKLG
jgi:hypothetical protein